MYDSLQGLKNANSLPKPLNAMEDNNQIAIYETADQSVPIEVRVKADSVWLTQRQIGLLFDRDYKTISKHILNVFEEGELKREATVAKFAIVQMEGAREVVREIEHYNLDVIISVGYRVKSRQGTQFRIWATQVLRKFLLDGYALHEKRLQEQEQNLKNLQQAVQLVAQVVVNHPTYRQDLYYRPY
ncbi:MAG TPA: RhuM family protein [Saprospiraceae bacterium]|nr:RhuM family protein [Saprospiraceae bacterium]HMQ84398.1 RhuM family protein [Saprospiraceae bacterium]